MKAIKIAALAVGAVALIATGVGAVALGGLAGTLTVAGISTSTLFLVAGGLSVAASLLQKGPKVPASQTDRLSANIDPRAYRKSWLGQTAAPVDVRYEEWSGKDQENCDWIVALASHAADGVDEIWLNSEMAWSATTGVVGKYVGYFSVPNIVLEGSPANAFTFASGKWNAASARLIGCAYLRLRFKVTGNSKKAESPFASGIPSRITIIGRGAKLYDPRRDSTVPGGSGPMRWNDQSTWRYTTDDGVVIGENLPLQILFRVLGWRIRNPANGVLKLAVGSGVPARRIGLESFQVAASLADELVNRAAGGNEPRYHGAGVVSEGDDPKTTLDALCAACCGRFRDTSGKLSLVIMHNDLAAAATDDGLSDDDVIGAFTWDPDPALDATPNIARGKYVDATTASLYQLVDYPEVALPSPDGQDRIFALDLGYVESPSQAQRIAKQVLQRKQYLREFTAPFDIRAWKYGVGDVVPFTFAPLGFARVLFRVKQQEQGQGSTCNMTLSFESPVFYSWDANDSLPVMAADPIVYDSRNNPLILAIDDAAGTAIWDGVTGEGKPADNADVTGDAYLDKAGRTIEQTIVAIDSLVAKADDLETMYGDTANASASAALAKTASQASQTAQANAEGAMANAIVARDAAATARDAALGAASSAQTARDQAGAAREASAAANAQAQIAATTAAQRAGDASGFAQTASGQATIATQKADAAGQAASTASAKADIASTKAGEASAYSSRAAISESNALGFSNAASSSAGVAVTSAGQTLPQFPDSALTHFGYAVASDAVVTKDVAGVGTVIEVTGSNYAYVWSRNGIPLVPNARIRFTLGVRTLSQSTGTGSATMGLSVGASDQSRISATAVPAAPSAGTTTIVANPVVPADDVWRETIVEYQAPAVIPAGFVFPKALIYTANQAPSRIVQIRYIRIEDVTATTNAAASAAASAGSASTASTKADAAGQSATSAAASATAANTSAGSAGTSASQASNSASNALGSSNSAATQSSAAAQSAANAANSANAASTSAQTAASSQTSAGQSASAAQASATTASTQAGNAQGYAGQASTSASQASTSATSANGSANTASGYMQQAASSRDAAGGSAGAAASSASVAKSASDSATSAATSASTSANNAYNQYQGAVGQAQAASSSAASASAFATAASQSATISASLATTAVNSNTDFNVWANVNGLPDGWKFWTNTDNTARTGGILGRPYAVRQSPVAGERLGFYMDGLRMMRGWSMLEARIRGYNSFSGAGVRFSGANKSYDLNFATDPDVAGTVRGGAETAGWSYTFSKLIYITAEDYGAVLYAFTAYDGLGDISAQKQIDWDHVAIRAATDGEIAGKRADGNATTALAQIATNAAAQASQNAAQAIVNSNVNATLNSQAAINTNLSQSIANNYAAASQQISTLSAYAATNQNYAPALTSWARAGGYSVLTAANVQGWTWGSAVVGSMTQGGEFSLAQTPAIYMAPNQNVTFSADLLCFGDGNQYVKLNILTCNSAGKIIDDRRGPDCRVANFSDSRARSAYAVTAYLGSDAAFCILRVLGQNASSAANPAGMRRPKFEAGGVATAYTEEGAAASLSASLQVLQQVTTDVQAQISTAVFQVLAQAGTSRALLKLGANGYGASQIDLVASGIRLLAQSNDDPNKAIEALTVRSDGRVDIPNLMANFAVVPAFGYFNGPRMGSGPDAGTSGGNTPTPIPSTRRPGQSIE